jgi:hypothetical protein
MRVSSSLLVLLLVFPVLAQDNVVGEVAFANSGKAEAQAAFRRGLALLHNFEYPRAAEEFRAAQQIDPAFAMAYWGEAMTHTHPIWFQQDLDAARAVLTRLGATPAERMAKAPTERERDYLRALDVLYGQGTKNERDFLFADAMAALHARYPDDVDATAFYAVALLGTAHQGRDFGIYMRAAALLEEVLPTHPRHPGVLHYLIHSYDDPVHAPLGMRAARVYGEVAPDAGHALHMTSHIFIALGMWDDVIAANRRAIDVVNQQRAAGGKGRAECGHYPSWLHYGLLQKGLHDEARAARNACRASALQTPFVANDPRESRRFRLEGYAEMRSQLAASGAGLTDADAVTMPADAKAPAAAFELVYGDVLAAAQRNDAVALASAATKLNALRSDVLAAIPSGTAANPTERVRLEVMLREAEALQLMVAGKRDEALPILKAAAEAERSMPLEFGPPVIAKPASELYADALLAAGRAEDAAAAYQLVVARAPGRTRAVEGLRVAQKAIVAKTAGKSETTTASPHVH